MRASLLTIGKELLIGQTVDTNSAWLGQKLEERGIEVIEIRSIADDPDTIFTSMKEMQSKSDILITTGGLGPTNDDLTKKVIADYFGKSMYFHQELFDKISHIFNKRNIPITDAIRNQCYMPQDIDLLTNNMGTAPGMWYENQGKILISMPGVPYEMKWIFEHQALPKISELQPANEHIYHRTIRTAGMGESSIAENIKDIEDGLPNHIAIAYLPSTSQVKIRVSGSGKNETQLIQEVNVIAEQIKVRVGILFYGYDNMTLGQALQNHCIENNLKLAVAESCTGGYLSHLITQISGSSGYYEGGFLVYSNALKINLLGVNARTLEKHGAVSEETVTEMLKGLLSRTNADIGAAISGIAGPGGGTKEKPVGTIWVAYGKANSIKTKKLQLFKDRKINIKYSAFYTLNALRKFLLQAEMA